MIRIYQVGGSIRDHFLGITDIDDIDYAVEAPSYQAMVGYLKDNNYTIFIEKPEYLTVRAKHPTTKMVNDFTLCRSDGAYTDARRPDTVVPGTIYDDLSRRDFTVNAIAKDQDGNYIDPFNGRKDLENMTLRCVGSTHDRLWEDSLRVLRGLRFSITKGFEMTPELHENIFQPNPELLSRLSAVSANRRQKELQHMFKHDSVRTMKVLSKLPDEMVSTIFKGGIWLLPTLKKIK